MSQESDQTNRERDEGEEDREAIARRLDEVLGRSGGEEPAEEQVPEGRDRPSGKLKLDKTGALVGRDKLKPKKPYARPGKEEPAPEPLPEGVGPVAEGPRKATIPPPLDTLRPPDMPPPAHMPPIDEVLVPGGDYLFGEEVERRDLPAFRIDRYPVTHDSYRLFVRATGHRPPMYWPDGVMPEELAQHPVVGVDYYDALAYAQWRGRDLPYEDEWERAARGTDGRTYPWGNDPELGQANTARLGHKVTLPVGWHEMNVTPDGVHDMIGNVWEITHSPAPGGGIVVRGGSWYDFVLYAKTWFRFASRPEARNGTIGFRCVRRDHTRPEVLREISEDKAAAEIAARRGPQPTPDAATFAADRRDLVPDWRRLRQVIEEREAEAAQPTPGWSPAPAVTTGRTGGRRPVKATPPPPIQSPPIQPPPGPPPAVEPPERVRPAAKKAAPTPQPEPTPQPKPAAQPKPMPEPVPKAPPSKPEPVPSSAPKPAPTLDRAGIRHASDMATKGAVATQEKPKGPDQPGTPMLYWSVLGSALALVVVFLVLLISGIIGGDEGGSEVAIEPLDGVDERPDGPPTRPPVARPPRGLPPAPARDPRDADPPRWIDGTRAGWSKDLGADVWIIVFVPDLEADSALTVRTANNIHRRLREQGADLLLVFPREAFLGDDGRPVSVTERNRRLRRLGGTVDLNVLLDAPAGRRYGGALRTHYRVGSPIAAIVIVDGRLEHKTSPFQGGLNLGELDPFAHRASQIRPPPSGD